MAADRALPMEALDPTLRMGGMVLPLPLLAPPVPPKRSMEEANVPVMPAPKPEDSPPSPPDGHGNVQIVRTHSAIGAIEDEDYDNMEGDEL